MNFKQLIVVAVCTVWIAGCQNTGLDRLDREVRALLREQQIRSLGETDNRDVNALSPRTADARIRGDDYERDPATHNPNVSELNVEPGEQTGKLPVGDELVHRERGNPAKVHTLSLEELLAFAIVHSPEYRDEKELLFIESINLLIEEHLWGPRFFNEMRAQFDGTPEGGDHDHAFSLINDLSVTRRLPYGGELSASALVSFVEQLRTQTGSTTASSQDVAFELAATIPLLRGAGKVAHESRIQAHRDLVYAVRRFERSRREFLVSLSTDYFARLRDYKQIQNAETQLAGLRKVQNLNEALAKAGRLPFFEVQQIQLRALSAFDRLETDREDLENALDRLKLRIGMPMSEKLVLKEQEFVTPVPKLDFVKSVDAANRNRLDLQTVYDTIADNRRQVEVARNQLLPDLDVDAALTLRTDPNKDRAGLDLDAGNSTYRVGVTYGAALDRRIEHLNHRRSLVNLERSERDYKLFRDTITLDVRRTIRDLERARASVAIQEKNVQLAEKRREGVILRLRSLPTREVIDAEDELNEAKDGLDAAATALRTAVLQYLLATGQMRVGPEGQWQAPVKLVKAE